MNILFLSQVFPDAAAPVRGTFNLELCRALAAEHKVQAISPRTWTERLARGWRGVKAGTAVEAAGVTAQYPTFWYLPRVNLHRSGAALERSIRSAARSIAKDGLPDVVLSYWAHPEGETGLELARSWSVPSVCIVGGSDVLLLPKSNRKRRDRIVRVLTESDAIITVSDGLRKACLELGASPERVRTIYQGVDTRLFRSGDKVQARKLLRISPHLPSYVWVGRLADVKNVDLILEAAALLFRAGGGFRVYIVGGGPEESRLRQLSTCYGLDGFVEFVGPVEPDRLPDWYRAADATLLTSRSEGLPNVLRESLACGTPFISTNVGSIAEIARPEVSLLIPPDDSRALVLAMERILAPHFREAAERHQARTWTDCAADIAALVRRLRDPRGLVNPEPTTSPGKPKEVVAATRSVDLMASLNSMIGSGHRP
jgi:teichuronic acid biosynthesis glycosyltransferase TuaC